MRLLQDLKNSLASMLQQGSPTWRRLLRGLLGQELLAWGASVVYLDDLAYDSLTRDLHPSSASDLGLSLLSASYSIPFQNFTPGVMLRKVQVSSVVKPYGMSYTFNATKWFNINPILPSGDDQIVELYQGVPLAMVSEGSVFKETYESISEILDVRSSDIFMDEDRSFFYVKLRGDHIIPKSVRVQVLEVVSGVTKARFMPMDEFSSESYFSVYTLPDGSQAVRFHSSIPDRYQITYFSASMSVPDSLNDDTLQSSNIIQITNPSISSLSKRSDFIKEMSKFSAIATIPQVEAFCKASGVVDAKAVRSKTVHGFPEVSVFFIPTVGGDAINSFYEGSLSEALGLYGSFSHFNVLAGIEVLFQVRVSSFSAFIDFSSLGVVIRQYFSVESPESFSRDLSEALMVYLHKSGFSDIQASFVLHIPKKDVFLIPDFSGVLTNYKFYDFNGVLDRWSFGSDILGVFESAPNFFSQTDQVFAMTSSVLVQRTGYYDVSDKFGLKKFYIFNRETGRGSFLNLNNDNYNFSILDAGSDMVFFSRIGYPSLVYVLRMDDEAQLYACSNGVLPKLLEINSLPTGLGYKLSVFDDGYFGVVSGSTYWLYRHIGSSVSNIGSFQDLLFVYKGKFYFKTASVGSTELIRKDDLSGSRFVVINFSINNPLDVGLSVEEFFTSKISIKDDIFTVVRVLGNKTTTFMFSAMAVSNSFVLMPFSDILLEGFNTTAKLSKYPVSWATTLCYFDGSVWSAFVSPKFAQKVGSVLSDGSPLFDGDYDYDYLTVETQAVKPFVNEFGAAYFRLNSQNPVIE
jgi:hypothetical protein